MDYGKTYGRMISSLMETVKIKEQSDQWCIIFTVLLMNLKAMD